MKCVLNVRESQRNFFRQVGNWEQAIEDFINDLIENVCYSEEEEGED